MCDDRYVVTLCPSGKLAHVKFPSRSREGSMLSVLYRGVFFLFIIPLNRKGILSSVFHSFTFSIFPYHDFTPRTLLLSFMIFYSSLFWLFTFIISSVLFCFRVGSVGWGIRIHRTEKLQLKSHFYIITRTKGQTHRSVCHLPSSLYPETLKIEQGEFI